MYDEYQGAQMGSIELSNLDFGTVFCYCSEIEVDDSVNGGAVMPEAIFKRRITLKI